MKKVEQEWLEYLRENDDLNEQKVKLYKEICIKTKKIRCKMKEKPNQLKMMKNERICERKRKKKSKMKLLKK